MIGLDTSVLVGLTIREHPAHAACLELFETRIRGMESSVAICGQWWHAVECEEKNAPGLSPGPTSPPNHVQEDDPAVIARKTNEDTAQVATS